MKWSQIERISEEESLRLLQTKSKLGRVAFVVDGRPTVLPVNYRAGDKAVYFCTADGTKLATLKDGAPAAFEVDASVSLYRSGWSVLVQGTAEEVSDPEDLYELRHGPLKSWATPSSEHWIRISIDQITGRPSRTPDVNLPLSGFPEAQGNGFSLAWAGAYDLGPSSVRMPPIHVSARIEQANDGLLFNVPYQQLGASRLGRRGRRVDAARSCSRDSGNLLFGGASPVKLLPMTAPEDGSSAP